MKYLILLALGLSLSATAAPAPAKAAASATPEQNADELTAIFVQACVASQGNHDTSNDWARKNGFAPVSDDNTQKILGSEKGQVLGSGGQFLLVLQQPHSCAVWAKTADANRVNQNIEQLVKSLERPTLTLKQSPDKTSTQNGISYRQRLFGLQKAGTEFGWVLLANTTTSKKAEVSAQLVFSPAKF